MSDFVNKVLTVYKADTSDAKAALRSLRGEEAKAARERLQEIEKQNQGIDAQIATFGKITLAVGAAVGAFKLAQTAAKNYLEDVRLESAAAGANIDKLREATHGLVETDKILEFAGKSMNGVWKLTQEEMEVVAKGAMALRKTMGGELQPIIEGLTDAVSKGSTRAFKEFGIEAKNKEEALNKLRETYAKTKGDVKLAGDEFVASEVKFRDAMDDLMGQLGKLAVELAPVVSLVAELISTWSEFYLKILPNVKQQLMGRNDPVGGMAGVLASEMNASLALTKKPFTYEEALAEAERLKRQNRGFLGPSADLATRPGEGRKRGAAGPLSPDEGWAKFMREFADPLRNKSGAGTEGVPEEFQDSIKQLAAGVHATGLNASAIERGPGLIEQIFGDPERIKQISVGVELASASMDILSQSAGAAMDAWITGQSSISDAIKKTAAEGIRALAVTMTTKSLFYGLEALGYLLMGNTVAAAAAGKLAGGYAAGAVAAGAMAKALGAGQATPAASAGGGAGGFIGSGGSGGGSRDNNVTIVLDDAWYGRSRTERAADMARAISQAKRGTSHVRRN